MSYIIIDDANNCCIAKIVETYNNHSIALLIPDNNKKKIKPSQIIETLNNINDDNQALILHNSSLANIANIDVSLLYDIIDEYDTKFTIQELAHIYFSENYSTIELFSLLLSLKQNNIIFDYHQCGIFSKANLDNQAQKKSNLQAKADQEQILNNYYTALINYQNPNFINNSNINQLINRPNKQSLEYQALNQASQFLKLTILELCYKVGLIGDIATFFLDTFLFDNFPNGINYHHDDTNLINQSDTQKINIKINNYLNNNIKTQAFKIFSIDDTSTTEIDDAFSLQIIDDHYIVGIHISAPAIDVALGDIIATNISSIYYPSNKITMLDDATINKYSLLANSTKPIVSIYFTLDQEYNIISYTSELENFFINHNLRHEELEQYVNYQYNHNNANDSANDSNSDNENDESNLNEDQSQLDIISVECPYQTELTILYQFALALEQKRGRATVNQLELDYTFSFINNNITLKKRQRGNPIDKLVSELMILANCTWGRMLTNNFIPAIYRVKQRSQPVHMTLNANSHTGLNVDYYTWSTSPLRRSVDYINQYQIIQMIMQNKNYYQEDNPLLLAVVNNFDAIYSKYIAIQDKLERYWSLKYLAQENIEIINAVVTFKYSAALDGVPIKINYEGLTGLQPQGTILKCRIFNINPINLTFEFKILS